MILTKRQFITRAAAFIAAPAIIRVADLMPIKPFVYIPMPGTGMAVGHELYLGEYLVDEMLEVTLEWSHVGVTDVFRGTPAEVQEYLDNLVMPV